MTLPSWLLLALGVAGGTDILLYHTLSHGLRAHAASRAELITHFLRGPTYALLFVVVPNVDLSGAWFLALLAVLLFDLGISLADFWFETESRRALGGLPRGEYILHIILAMLFGALVCSVLQEAGTRWSEPTDWTWLAADAGPWVPLRIALTLMAPGVLLTGLADLWAVLKLGRTNA